MKTKVFFGLTSLVGLFLLLSSMDGYQVKSLPPLSIGLPPFTAKNLKITARAYTADESKTFLGRDLISRGYQPVQITIQNDTPNEYKISEKGISLPTVSASKVARSVLKSSIPRSIGYKIAGFLFWPFLIPGTIDSIRTFKSHVKLKNDFKAKAIKEEAIAPYSTLHRILFVPSKEYKKEFSVTMIDQENGRKETVHLS